MSDEPLYCRRCGDTDWLECRGCDDEYPEMPSLYCELCGGRMPCAECEEWARKQRERWADLVAGRPVESHGGCRGGWYRDEGDPEMTFKTLDFERRPPGPVVPIWSEHDLSEVLVEAVTQECARLVRIGGHIPSEAMTNSLTEVLRHVARRVKVDASGWRITATEPDGLGRSKVQVWDPSGTEMLLGDVAARLWRARR